MEQQLREYQRQLQEIYQEPRSSRLPQHEPGQHNLPHVGIAPEAHAGVRGAPFRLTALEGLGEGPLPRRAPSSEVPQGLERVSPLSSAREYHSLESSPLESLSSYELEESPLFQPSSEEPRLGGQKKVAEVIPEDSSFLGPPQKDTSARGDFSGSHPSAQSIESEELSAVTSIPVTASLGAPSDVIEDYSFLGPPQKDTSARGDFSGSHPSAQSIESEELSAVTSIPVTASLGAPSDVIEDYSFLGPPQKDTSARGDFSGSHPSAQSIESEELSAVTSIPVTASLGAPSDVIETASLQTSKSLTSSVSSPSDPPLGARFVPPLRVISEAAHSATGSSGVTISSAHSTLTGSAFGQGGAYVTPLRRDDISPASLSRPTSQTSHYSPSYLDYFRQKLEEERRLIAVQRNRITQRQKEHHSQLTRYGTILSSMNDQRYATPETTSGDVSVGARYMDPSRHSYVRMPLQVEPLFEGSSATSVEERGQKAFALDRIEKNNHSGFANTAHYTPETRLGDMTARLGLLEKSLNLDPWAGKTLSRTEGTVRSPTPVALPVRHVIRSSESSAHESSHSSSGMEYHSLPHSVHSSDTREDASGGRTSTGSSLSELTEMMTRLTSSSEETSEEARTQAQDPDVPTSQSLHWTPSLLLSSSDGSSKTESPGTGGIGISQSAISTSRGPGAPGVPGTWILKNQGWRAPSETRTSSHTPNSVEEARWIQLPGPSESSRQRWNAPIRANTISSSTLSPSEEGPQMPLHPGPRGSQGWYVPTQGNTISLSTLSPSEEGPSVPFHPGPRSSQGWYVPTRANTISSSTVSSGEERPPGSQVSSDPTWSSTLSVSTQGPSEVMSRTHHPAPAPLSHPFTPAAILEEEIGLGSPSDVQSKCIVFWIFCSWFCVISCTDKRYN